MPPPLNLAPHITPCLPLSFNLLNRCFLQSLSDEVKSMSLKAHVLTDLMLPINTRCDTMERGGGGGVGGSCVRAVTATTLTQHFCCYSTE